MKDNATDLFLVNGINGASIAALTLNDVKDGVAVVLGVVSIISTLLIIRGNLRKQKAEKSQIRSASDELPAEKKVTTGGIAIIVILILLGLLGSGCSTLDSLYGKEIQQIPGAPIGTTIYRTNVVLEAASTNSAGIVTPARMVEVVTPEVSVQYAPPTYVTNLVPRADVDAGIKASGAVPVPWAGAVALGLGWLYSAYASLRNKQVAKALVQSVQVGREFLQSTPEGAKLDAEVKRLLARHQEYAGVAEEVGKLLSSYVPGHTRN
jgi:hypothetical protein